MLNVLLVLHPKRINEKRSPGCFNSFTSAQLSLRVLASTAMRRTLAPPPLAEQPKIVITLFCLFVSKLVVVSERKVSVDYYLEQEIPLCRR